MSGNFEKIVNGNGIFHKIALMGTLIIRISLQWPIHIISSVDKTKLSYVNTLFYANKLAWLLET